MFGRVNTHGMKTKDVDLPSAPVVFERGHAGVEGSSKSQLRRYHRSEKEVLLCLLARRKESISLSRLLRFSYLLLAGSYVAAQNKQLLL